MMPDVQRAGPFKRKAIAPWRPRFQHHYHPLHRWMGIVILFLFPDHSHHWVTRTAVPISKGHRLGLFILQPTRPQNTTEQRKEIRGALSNLSRYPPTCKKFPSMAGLPLRIFPHPESIKTEKSRFQVRLVGHPSRRDTILGPAERTRKKRPQNNLPLIVTVGRNRSQKCSGDLEDQMVCSPLHYY